MGGEREENTSKPFVPLAVGERKIEKFYVCVERA